MTDKIKVEYEGTVYEYDPKSGTKLLDFLKEEKADVKFQCQDGYCGVCRCKMTKGSVKEVQESIGYKDKGDILPCISIPVEDVSLEKKVHRL